MSARYRKRSAAGTVAGIDHANGVHPVTFHFYDQGRAQMTTGTERAGGVPL
jgi:hypothetical protein